MASGMSPDELPPGWKEHIKVSNGRKNKYFTNDEMGLKFYTKKQVIEFVSTKDVCQGTSHSVSEHDQNGTCSKSEASPVVVERNESLEWLPRGWIIESRNRKKGPYAGAIYKTYIEPSTGYKFYSKPQVIKYLESVNCNVASGEQKKEASRSNSSKQDIPEHCESIKGKSHISGEEENDMGNPSLEIVCCKDSGDTSSKQDVPQHWESMKDKGIVSAKEENGMGKPSLNIVPCVMYKSNELPTGWIKEIRARKSRGQDTYYIDPISGYEFLSKKDVFRYLETGDISCCVMKPKKSKRSVLKLIEDDVSKISRDTSSKQDAPEHCESMKDQSIISGNGESGMGKPSLDIVPCVVDKSNVLDELPPGWIKEIRARKSHGQDTYYIDPVSGYEFRSKKDVLRYLKTGDIGHCAIKPKKSNSSVLKFVEGDVSDSAPAVLHKQKKQPEAERSKETEGNNISVDAKVATLTLDPSEDKKVRLELIRLDKLADSSQQKTEGSKIDVKVDDDGAVSSIATAILNGQKQPEDVLDTDTQIHLKKSKKRKPPSMPIRSSKRLLGQGPDMLPKLGSSERASQAAGRKPVETEAYTLSSLGQNAAANGLPQQLNTKPVVPFLGTEMQNSIENPSRDQGVGEQAVGQVNERRDEENPRCQDSQFWYPFGDSLADPCYEFAFKTLTGEIPLEDSLAFSGCCQPQIETSCTQGDVSFGMLEIDTTPVLFQNDVPLHFDSLQQNTSTNQLPTNLAIPSGNINLPSCSSFGSQQPSLEARSKDYETRVDS
ncbi:hypothetical protein ACH5RR_041528 [Cinchona calisaya]|uniref:MBD domain-containing protein n=1 Tax=Cinchona calisaya TaxID=153742 RepID=A0ABD2XVL9_9GENT